MKKVKEGIYQRDDGHYEMPLPFRESVVKLPNNKEMALNLLDKLKRRLNHDSKYRDDYLCFMKDFIDHDYAERVPPEMSCRDDGQVWYIPQENPSINTFSKVQTSQTT